MFDFSIVLCPWYYCTSMQDEKISSVIFAMLGRRYIFLNNVKICLVKIAVYFKFKKYFFKLLFFVKRLFKIFYNIK